MVVKSVSKFKEHCNAFFMELVSSCCFADHVHGPEKGLVDLLLHLVTGNDGRGTRTLSPFGEHDYIDRTPVIRSFLLQLLLRFR